MPKTALRLLPLIALAPALAGCGVIPLPTIDLPDVKNIAIVQPTPANPTQPDPTPGVVTPDEIGAYSRFYQKGALFAEPVPGSVKNITISGEARLKEAAETRTVIDVLVVENFDEANCQPEAYAQAFRVCKASVGTVVGKLVFEKGSQAAPLNLSGSIITELAHKGKGHVGLELKEGAISVTNDLSFTNLKVDSRF